MNVVYKVEVDDATYYIRDLSVDYISKIFNIWSIIGYDISTSQQIINEILTIGGD